MVAQESHQHAAPRGFIRKWVFSLDHKVIGLQYYFLALAAVFTGMFLSLLMRLHLICPTAVLPLVGEIKPETYLSLLTMHGTIMVFFVPTTAPQGGFGNYFLPIQIGAPDMAFPVLNMLSFWTTFVAFVVMLAAFIVPGGAPLHGWTGYAPLSAIPSSGPGEALGADLWIISIAIFCIGALMGSLNFITTTLDMRAKGMSLMRMPLTCWAWFITAILGLLAFGVLFSGGILLLMDRNLGTSFFVSLVTVNGQLTGHKGGSPLLLQHLFWFFGHPEVYIAILPAMGIVSHILINSMRKPLLSAKVIIYSMMSIGFLSYMVWGHHMFVSGMNPMSSLAFSFPTLTITIPATVMTLIWLGSLYGANLQINSASLFALGFISMFVSGGVSGFFLAQPSIDIYLHGTYFVVGHFHLVMGVAALFGVFAGTYFWFPKMTGRMMNDGLGKIHFLITFIGAYCIFMPFHYLGLVGNVRRYSSFVDDFRGPDLMNLHRFITISALVTGAAQFIFLFNLIYSRFKGAPAPNNPWMATTLEWSMPSPPPWNNLGCRNPLVYPDPYQSGVKGPP